MNQLPDADNTMIIYIVGDNGASAEGGPDGTLNEVKALNGFPTTKEPASRLRFNGPFNPRQAQHLARYHQRKIEGDLEDIKRLAIAIDTIDE